MERDGLASVVIGPDFTGDDDGGRVELGVVYLPAQRARRGDAEAVVEFRRIEDDQLAVLAYTSLKALVEGCGERQPWVSIPRDHLDQVVADSGADLVAWDATLPPEHRRDSPPPDPTREAGR